MMAVTITYDINESRFAESLTAASWERDYRAVGILDAPVADMIQEVLTALGPYGSVAPAPFLGMFLSNKSIERIIAQPGAATKEAYGTVVYTFSTSTDTTPPPPNNDQDVLSISVSSFTEEVEIEKNFDGTRITVEDNDGVVRGETVTVPKARARISARRKELDYPKNRIDTFTNAINQFVWNSYPIGTVRCETIDVDSVSGGVNYDVQYIFVYRPEGWNNIEVVGRDLATGRPIANPTGPQIVTVDPYKLEDFGSLNINFA